VILVKKRRSNSQIKASKTLTKKINHMAFLNISTSLSDFCCCPQLIILLLTRVDHCRSAHYPPSISSPSLPLPPHTRSPTLFCRTKPIGASPLTKCCFSTLYFSYVRYWGGGDGGWWFEERKEHSAGYHTESQRCKSSASRKSFKHRLLHHTPCCFLS
jgi:hypothetical protein